MIQTAVGTQNKSVPTAVFLVVTFIICASSPNNLPVFCFPYGESDNRMVLEMFPRYVCIQNNICDI